MSIIHPFLKESAEEAHRDNDHVLAFLQMLEDDGGIQPTQPNLYCHLESLKKELWIAYLATLVSDEQKKKAMQDMDAKNSLVSALESKGLEVDKKGPGCASGKTRKPWPPYVLDENGKEVQGPPVQGRYVYGMTMWRPKSTPETNAADYDLLLQRPWEEGYVKPWNVTDQFN